MGHFCHHLPFHCPLLLSILPVFSLKFFWQYGLEGKIIDEYTEPVWSRNEGMERIMVMAVKACASQKGKRKPKKLFLLLIALTIIVMHTSAMTTGLHVVKYASDRNTILAEKTISYQWMESNLPVMGDGNTHYYHQGPVFVDDADPVLEEQLRWNPKEDTNIHEKDMGAVKGTDVRDLCDLVGGMTAADTLIIKASDGMTKELAYANVYSPSARQGPAVITWYCAGIASCSGPYPDSGYSDGMRLVFFADNSVNPWGEHVFGNFDWHESSDPKDWYYYMSSGEKYPTTTGLSIKSISEIQIYSTLSSGSSSSSGAGVSGGVGGAVLPLGGSAPPDNPALYGYKGKTLNTFKTATLNGSLLFFSDQNGQPVLANNRIREFNISVDLPPGSNVTLARMYVYLSGSHNLQSHKGVIPSLYATLNKEKIETDQMYFDTDGDDNAHVAATYVYDVRKMLKGNGIYSVSVWNLDYEQSVFTIEGVLLVTAYENETAPLTSYWIDEGCDVISSLPEKGLFPDDCKTSYPFAGTVNKSTFGDAYMYLVSTGLDRDNSTEHTVNFNNGKWANFFDNKNGSLVMPLPVRIFINETGNKADIQSTIHSQNADYLVNRNAFLIVEYKDSNSSAIIQNVSISGQVPLAPSSDAIDTFSLTEDSRNCQIILDSDPIGALVYIDGQYRGKTTPYTLEAEKGDYYSVRFELDGYEPSEISFIATNSTCIRTSLYAPVHTTKGRLKEIPVDPDGIRYGGLSISSRPNRAIIFIDGINTGKTTPSVFMGLEPGSHTIKLVRELRDQNVKERSEFVFEEQNALVLSNVLGQIDINGIGYTNLFEVIIDSHNYRGLAFTLNGYPLNATIPKKVSTPQSNSFVTIHENESYVSYPIPILMDEDHYLLLEPRNYQNLRIAVNSDPQGAEVFIDGFNTGYTTPYIFGNISDGSHRIMVTKDGYLPQQNVIDLPRCSVPISMTPVDFVLEEYPSGFLYVNSIPNGGKISIDGLYTGEVTPALFRSLPTGTHSVQVTGINVTKTFPEITINSLEMTTLTADFTPYEES
jgi:hypothetical protein